jgi:hypothetical protein
MMFGIQRTHLVPAGLLDSSNQFGLGQTATGFEKRMGDVPIESPATKSAMGMLIRARSG